MKKVWRFLRKYGWAIAAGVAAVFGIVVGVLVSQGRVRGQTIAGGEEPDAPKPMPFVERARREAERARLEGELERARVRAEAQGRTAVLDHIDEVAKDDPAEARRQLAKWMAGNL